MKSIHRFLIIARKTWFRHQLGSVASQQSQCCLLIIALKMVDVTCFNFTMKLMGPPQGRHHLRVKHNSLCSFLINFNNKSSHRRHLRLRKIRCLLVTIPSPRARPKWISLKLQLAIRAYPLMIHQMCHIVCLKRGLVLLIFGEVLPEHQPIQDIERLSMRLKTLLHQSGQLHIIFELVIGTIGIHHV